MAQNGLSTKTELNGGLATVARGLYAASSMTSHQTDHPLSAGELLDGLTRKEREVLDLLVQHHTTKDMARLLDLSPYTVDMRLRNAREKLGAVDRYDAARLYRKMLGNYGKTACEISVMSTSMAAPLATPPEPRNARFTLRDASSFALPAPWENEQPTEFSEVLDRRFGIAWRVAAIPLGALSIALLALALIAIAEQLGMLI
jgi:DNA-binding CsgD family transcriptional regulator